MGFGDNVFAALASVGQHAATFREKRPWLHRVNLTGANTGAPAEGSAAGSSCWCTGSRLGIEEALLAIARCTEDRYAAAFRKALASLRTFHVICRIRANNQTK